MYWSKYCSYLLRSKGLRLTYVSSSLRNPKVLPLGGILGTQSLVRGPYVCCTMVQRSDNLLRHFSDGKDNYPSFYRNELTFGPSLTK